MGCVIRICLNVESQETDDAKNCETLYIGDYEYVIISSFAGIKLWLEENGDLNRNDP